LKYYLDRGEEIRGFFVFILHMQEILRTDLAFPKTYTLLEFSACRELLSSGTTRAAPGRGVSLAVGSFVTDHWTNIIANDRQGGSRICVRGAESADIGDGGKRKREK
jgi:hypothetical protein